MCLPLILAMDLGGAVMSKDRVTLHKGKEGSAKHNEHYFYEDDRDVAVIRPVKGKRLEEGEIEIYTKKFGEGIELQNERYRKKGNYSRVKSVEEVYASKRYRPTEEILQCGSVSSEKIPTKEEFKQMAKEYYLWLREWSKQNGNHLTVLSLACHFDEASPHAHLREIWSYIDENGVEKIGQEKGMEQAGIKLPELTVKEREKREEAKKKSPKKIENDTDRNYNRGITFTKMCREKWQDICEAHGFVIERVPLENGRKRHETVAEYHTRKGRELEAKEEDLKEAELEIVRAKKDLEKKLQEIRCRENALKERQEKLEERELKNQELIVLGRRVKAEQILDGISMNEMGQKTRLRRLPSIS